MATRKPRLIAVVAIAILILAACGSDTVDVGDGGSTVPPTTDTTAVADDGASVTRPTLAGDWLLVALTVDGAEVPIPSGLTVDMNIDQGQIGGSGGCNSFGGVIDASDDGSLSITDMAWTEMGCEPQAIMTFETSYLSALSQASSWKADPHGITFLGDADLIRYEPGAEPVHLPLVGTAWTFDTIYSGEGVDRAASSTDQSLPPVTLLIDDASAGLTSDDCGTLSFPLSYEDGRDGNIAIPDKELADIPSCDGNANMNDAIAGIWAASGFMIDENRLTFIGIDGETVGFRAMAAL